MFFPVGVNGTSARHATIASRATTYVIMASSSVAIVTWSILQWRARKRARSIAANAERMVQDGMMVRDGWFTNQIVTRLNCVTMVVVLLCWVCGNFFWFVLGDEGGRKKLAFLLFLRTYTYSIFCTYIGKHNICTYRQYFSSSPFAS
mmetsp:Transcript_22297/g.33313  ORF Transcript_22297/g.33313 Transcript_22297/m.33313 type:complete len:147 (-) Transcript_22297:1386-1826(-)